MDIDSGGMIRAVDPGFADAIGLPTKLIVDRPLLVFIAATDRVAFLRVFRAAIDEKVAQCTVEVGAPDGVRMTKQLVISRESERLRCCFSPEVSPTNSVANEERTQEVVCPAESDRTDPGGAARGEESIEERISGLVHAKSDPEEPSPPRPKSASIERWLLAGVQAAAHGVAILDSTRPGVPIIGCNESFRRQNGIESEEALFVSLCPEGVDFQPWGRIRLALSRGEPCRETVRFSRGSGQTFLAELCLTPIPDFEHHYLCIQSDVSERARLERDLRDSESRYRAVSELISHVTYGYRVADGRMELAWLSGQVPAITGHTKDELQQLGSWRAIAHPDDLERVEAHFERLLAGQESEVEYRIVRRNGVYRWLCDHARPVADAAGRIVEVVGAARDFTRERRFTEESRAREEEGRQTKKMDAIARLAGGVAHDFNNLLTTILGNVSLLEDRLSEHADVAGPLIDEVVQAARQASELTQQLLAFGERQVLRPEPLDLNEVAIRAVGLLERLIPESTKLLLDRVAGDLRILTDRSQIEQIVLNLGLNAQHALADTGTIRVETRDIDLEDELVRGPVVVPAGRYARLSVIDDGVGFDETVRDQIFEPFFTTKGVGEGRGLGLATVYGTVRQSGGLITVESAPGCGTRFDVYFPISDAEIVAKPELVPAEPGRVVLVVEDDPAVRRLLCQVLREAGFQILEAENGARALEVLHGNARPVDLLVTDIVMPELGGRDLAQRVRAAHPDTRVLFISGYSYDAIACEGVLEEDVQFLQKPFVPEAFTAKVRSVLAR